MKISELISQIDGTFGLGKNHEGKAAAYYAALQGMEGPNLHTAWQNVLKNWDKTIAPPPGVIVKEHREISTKRIEKPPQEKTDWDSIRARALKIEKEVIAEHKIDPIFRSDVRDYAWLAAQMEAMNKSYRTFLNSQFANSWRKGNGLEAVNYDYSGSKDILAV